MKTGGRTGSPSQQSYTSPTMTWILWDYSGKCGRFCLRITIEQSGGKSLIPVWWDLSISVFVLWFNCSQTNIKSCLTGVGIDLYWEKLDCFAKSQRLLIEVSRFVCFTFHVTKETMRWMRTNTTTFWLSGWMYVLIQWLNETPLIITKHIQQQYDRLEKHNPHCCSVWMF